MALKDPLVLDFPLALSYEPRLLPLAVKNGFRIDVKVLQILFPWYVASEIGA